MNQLNQSRIKILNKNESMYERKIKRKRLEKIKARLTAIIHCKMFWSFENSLMQYLRLLSKIVISCLMMQLILSH